MNKIRIIDLLNKIANGEEVPLFKYEEKVYKYNKNNECFDELYNDEDCKSEIYFCELNDEVEIFIPTLNNLREQIGLPKIEQKKIPEKLEEYIHTDSLNYNQCNYMFEKLTNKYNEIIDYLKSKGE